MNNDRVLRVIIKLLFPFVLLFALYVQFHGDFGPGGGFQAGVLAASAFIAYSLIFGTRRLHEILSVRFLEICSALGVLLYGGTGLVALIQGGRFLDYSYLGSTQVKGQLIGIFVVELGVFLTVASVMLNLFFMFADRKPAGD